MEEKMNINNEIKKSKNNSKIIIIVLVILLVGALGFICYDKFINKEKPSVPTTKPATTPIGKYNKIVLTTENQYVNIGGKTLSLSRSIDGVLVINDGGIGYTEEGIDLPLHANIAYVMDDFILFTDNYEIDGSIYLAYAIDANGDELSFNIPDSIRNISDIRIDNNQLVAVTINNGVTTEYILKHEISSHSIINNKKTSVPISNNEENTTKEEYAEWMTYLLNQNITSVAIVDDIKHENHTVGDLRGFLKEFNSHKYTIKKIYAGTGDAVNLRVEYSKNGKEYMVRFMPMDGIMDVIFDFTDSSDSELMKLIEKNDHVTGEYVNTGIIYEFNYQGKDIKFSIFEKAFK